MLTIEQELKRDNRKRQLRASTVLNDYAKKCEPKCASADEILTDLGGPSLNRRAEILEEIRTIHASLSNNGLHFPMRIELMADLNRLHAKLRSL